MESAGPWARNSSLTPHSGTLSCRLLLRHMAGFCSAVDMMHAKSRLGGGIRISATADAPLEEAITQVVEEIRAAFPEREILLEVSFGRPVSCDAPRVAQAISNLLSNAVRHGAQSAPIEVRGLIDQGEIEISVTNQGEAVPEDLRQNLFQPFRRGARTEGDGLGLGLYIASSIAMAHGGRIDVTCGGGPPRSF